MQGNTKRTSISACRSLGVSRSNKNTFSRQLHCCRTGMEHERFAWDCSAPFLCENHIMSLIEHGKGFINTKSPPMGWISWFCPSESVSEDNIRQSAVFISECTCYHKINLPSQAKDFWSKAIYILSPPIRGARN